MTYPRSGQKPRIEPRFSRQIVSVCPKHNQMKSETLCQTIRVFRFAATHSGAVSWSPVWWRARLWAQLLQHGWWCRQRLSYLTINIPYICLALLYLHTHYSPCPSPPSPIAHFGASNFTDKNWSPKKFEVTHHWLVAEQVPEPRPTTRECTLPPSTSGRCVHS